MPQSCTVCVHEERQLIDRAIVAGQANRRIAAQFALSEIAIRRHKAEHLPQALTRSKAAREKAAAGTLLAQIQRLQIDARRIRQKAEKEKDLKTAISAIRELLRMIELLAKLKGELDERPSINILIIPEWAELRDTLMRALKPFPEARAAVARALLEVEP